MAVHGVIAIVAGNLAGLLMGFDKSFLSCGLFGYNSFLVGLALGKVIRFTSVIETSLYQYYDILFV